VAYTRKLEKYIYVELLKYYPAMLGSNQSRVYKFLNAGTRLLG